MQINIENYLSKFTIRESERLFDLDDEWKLIKSGVCPVCSCQLKVSQKGDVYCNSAKHKKMTKTRLFIRAGKLK